MHSYSDIHFYVIVDGLFLLIQSEHVLLSHQQSLKDKLLLVFLTISHQFARQKCVSNRFLTLQSHHLPTNPRFYSFRFIFLYILKLIYTNWASVTFYTTTLCFYSSFSLVLYALRI